MMVYLDGPITGQSYDGANDWRHFVASYLEPEILSLSPMRYKDFLRGSSSIGDSYQDQKHPLSLDKGIITRDRLDVRGCDLVFFNFLGASKASIGSCVELGWADAFGKPIVVAMDPSSGNAQNHGFVRQLTGFTVLTLEKGVELIKQILLPETGPRRV
jgi:hypothetical protein